MHTLRACAERREVVGIATRSVGDRRVIEGREVGRPHGTYQAEWRSNQVCHIRRKLVASDKEGHAEHGSRGMGNPWREGSGGWRRGALALAIFSARCHQVCKASTSGNVVEKNNRIFTNLSVQRSYTSK